MITEKDDLGIIGVVVEDWDIQKAFRPKTITTDYSSWIAYISRKAVPENTPITNTEYWKPLTRLQSQLAFDYMEFKRQLTEDFENYKNNIDTKFNNLRLLVESFLRSTEFGVALANEFGDNTFIGVNQKLLTESLNKLWTKFEDITGEIIQGINMVVTPTYFISENGCDVHITANTVETNGIFEHIAFYGNGSLIVEADNVDFFEYDTEIEETTIIKCVAKIMGIEYTREKLVTHYNSFWLGAGSAYPDIMDVEHVIPITNGMRGAYNINVAQGQHIIIIVGESLAGGFLRADLNSVEINFTESTVTVDGKNYKVFTSDEAYSAGTYNIDING